MDQAAAYTAAAQPVAVAALTRTSTLDLQDPVASARRQLRTITGWLPPGWYIAAVYSDVESGATSIDGRSRTESWRVLTDAGLPRDGGMADLLADAAAPNPKFSVVVVEDIERASRDFYDSVKLERKLGSHGVPLLATDEPADITGLNATTVLVRRVKQGVAEWYRIQLKAKTRKGLEEHAIAGYNNGRVPYGYIPDRTPHPVTVKASQGRTKTRLAVDPHAGPWVTQMFQWRVYENLSREAIALRLDAAGAPSPDGEGWHPTAVGKILANPKYTGYMVYGRTRNTGKSQRPGERKVRAVPREEWTWSAQPSHPALVTRELWQAAQRGGRRYPLRSRLRDAQCGHRMSGTTRAGRRDDQSYTYYVCPNNTKNPHGARKCPDHVRASIREDVITAAIAGFLDEYVLGHDRAAMLERLLPSSAADQAARRDAQAAELTRAWPATTPHRKASSPNSPSSAATPARPPPPTGYASASTTPNSTTRPPPSRPSWTPSTTRPPPTTTPPSSASCPTPPGSWPPRPTRSRRTCTRRSASSACTGPAKIRSPSARSSPTPHPGLSQRCLPTPAQAPIIQTNPVLRLTNRTLLL